MHVNGKEVAFSSGTLLTFLEQNGYNPAHVVVERNGDIFAREQFAAVALAPEDDLNILHFMGGG
ncbi:MAG: sulfur carrier protein ThiS [Oscillospiraceae bacterium]|jgi:thiamine biosynthesis protein ThiS|nr:sulfur carrier protein ThiS [Oscillospiraceae bacterium]